MTITDNPRHSRIRYGWRDRSRANVSGCTSVYPTRSPIAKQPKSKRGRWRTAPLRYELDIASGNFDPSPVNYKPQKKESISVSDLFDQFVEYKRRSISIGGLNKYLGLQKHVSVFFKNKTTISVSESFAEKFRDWLAEKLEAVTVRERIVLMNACWVWGLKKKLVVENPWLDVRVIVAPKQRPQPFTLAEISAIVHKFRSDPDLNHYADYVEFKFGVGLRTGEAAALLWRHCSSNCDRLWIGESLSNGDRNGTKTNKARTVPLTLPLQQLLLS